MSLLGVDRTFVCRSTGITSPDLAELLSRAPAARVAGLDPIGVSAAWSELASSDPTRTCLRGVRVEHVAAPRASIASDRRPPPTTDDDLAEVLSIAARHAVGDARRPVVALGGGIDAPLAVLAARRAGIRVDRALTVAIPGSSYDESAAACEHARALGLELEVIEITVADLAAALPEAVRRAACAFYNLHPVSRTLLARAARARGFDALLTGDGADQAARGASGPADYVPLVAAITRGADLRWAAPFADDAAVTTLVRRARDALDPARDLGADPKRALRALAVTWSLPERLAYAPKRATFAPPLPREAFPDDARVARLARAVGRPLAWSGDDRINVGIASLAALLDVLGMEI